MKIRFLVSAAGLAESYRPGEEREVNDAEGARLVRIGHAEAVAPAMETATKKYDRRKR